MNDVARAVRHQRTLARPVSYSGRGLHTGAETTARFLPAPANSGVRFRRVDLPGSPEIPADIQHVVDTNGESRRTTIGVGPARVTTVEHILAAVHGLEIDNLVIELDGGEPGEPDGSAMPIVDLFREAGIVEQTDGQRSYFSIGKPIAFTNGRAELVALPHDGFRLSFTIDYDNPIIGNQYVSMEICEDTFVREIASARTFALSKEVEALKARGLIKGGSYDNAVVVGEKEVLSSTPLRYPNEFVRHKMLDLLGDLFLLGMPIRGHIIAIKSGHGANVEFVRRIRRWAEESKGPVLKLRRRGPAVPGLDINAIQRIMPHRYPLLLVDRILELEEGKRVVGIKNVSINEPFFVGHFPGHPIMPAVLIIEAMAQVGGVLLLSMVDNPEEKLVYFMGIDNAKFRKPVIPGDQLRFELELVKLKSSFCKMSGKAFVDGSLVAEADLLSKVVDR
ncbi:MAG: bifunctional UDP-3-O-[3-hydroxymyristoyl] N-acetylglucosamine deacetylase/3-hydroxyacyl-ACP dehydratase [bacterium]